MPNSKINWMPIHETLANQLLEFALKVRSKIGKSIELYGETYTLDYVSQSHTTYYSQPQRSLSVYFRVGRSVVRISDHWASSRHHPRSKKLNCTDIDGHEWHIDNKAPAFSFHGLGCGKYSWVLLAGRASLVQLNRTCKHWRTDRAELKVYAEKLREHIRNIPDWDEGSSWLYRHGR